ncbi:MAG: hypothetical protein C0483_18305 [Pirellula sp.]|nr:hypothetical protein [Pirellula sp.]
MTVRRGDRKIAPTAGITESPTFPQGNVGLGCFSGCGARNGIRRRNFPAKTRGFAATGLFVSVRQRIEIGSYGRGRCAVRALDRNGPVLATAIHV